MSRSAEHERTFLNAIRRAFPFEIAKSRPLQIRTERIELGIASPLRILYASDLHFGWPWTNGVTRELVEAAENAKPDIILLGGDLADRHAGLKPLSSCAKALSKIAPLFAIHGNHDRRPGVHAVRNAVISAGGFWLRDFVQPHLQRGVYLCADAAVQPPSDAPAILCGHNPAVITPAAASGYRLVLAGHLHGGQCVLATIQGRHYPGAWFARWTGSRFSVNDTEMIVSNGAADTLPLRWNCPREVILCEIT